MTKSRPRSNPPVAAEPIGEITGGVDTHRDAHVVAALDSLGRLLGTAEFPTTTAGYAALRGWLTGFGPLTTVGVEGTGDYGAGLTQHLLDQRVKVIEINRPNRQKRRRHGKSDPIDAINAARAVLSGEATALPKPRHGPVESVRALHDTKNHLIKARTAALNTLRALIVTAPPALREQLTGLTPAQLPAACLRLHTPTLPAKGLRGPARTTAHHQLAQALLDHDTATRTALTTLADTITSYNTRIAALTTQLTALLTAIAPRTLAQPGLGPDTTAQLLITAGTHPQRLHSEAAFAKLTGVAPLDASSGQRQHHHRLSRAGDRNANSALYRITITRLAHCPRTRTYMTTRLNPNGSNKKHLIRCLKRYISREIYPHLTADLTTLLTLDQP